LAIIATQACALIEQRNWNFEGPVDLMLAVLPSSKCSMKKKGGCSSKKICPHDFLLSGNYQYIRKTRSSSIYTAEKMNSILDQK